MRTPLHLYHNALAEKEILPYTKEMTELFCKQLIEEWHSMCDFYIEGSQIGFENSRQDAENYFKEKYYETFKFLDSIGFK